MGSPPEAPIEWQRAHYFLEFAFGLSTGTLRTKSLSCGDYLLGPMRSVRYACKYLLFPSVGGLSRIVFAIFGTFELPVDASKCQGEVATGL